MPKAFYCSRCTSQHPRPVGKRCQVAGESLVSDVEAVAPPPPFSVRYKFCIRSDTATTPAVGREDGQHGQAGAAD